MSNQISPLSSQIAETARIFADPRRVETLLALMEASRRSASELGVSREQDFSTATKRLRLLEQHGILKSKRLPTRRIFSVSREWETCQMLNQLLRYGANLRS